MGFAPLRAIDLYVSYSVLSVLCSAELDGYLLIAYF